MIEALPYDRERTTLGRFPMCAACAAEYGDPADRRFHAEAIACPACGPALALLSGDGAVVARREPALAAAAEALRGGEILALKGLGGYQLLTDATSEAAVARLRARKQRDEKPFALLVATIEEARHLCVVSGEEEELLASPAAPIVLLDRRPAAVDAIAAGVAPGLGRLGLMLPSTPLHDLLARAAGRPLVCTSGNRAEEPLCVDEAEALARLGGNRRSLAGARSRDRSRRSMTRSRRSARAGRSCCAGRAATCRTRSRRRSCGGACSPSADTRRARPRCSRTVA